MIALPFVYFVLLLIYTMIRNKGYDVGAYMVSLYAITSFFAILIDAFNLRPPELVNYQIGILPAFMYCFLITICILPFILYSSKRIGYIQLGNEFIFKLIIYLYFTIFIVNVIMGFSTMVDILKGDLGALRQALRHGELEHVIDISGPLKPLLVFFNMLGSLSVFMLIPFFYSLRYLKKPIWFNLVILCSSFPILISGILGIDRSKFIIWGFSFCFMLVMFYQHLDKRKKRQIKILTIILAGAMVAYLTSVTISRFGDSSYYNSSVGGTEGGVITYAGQPYLYFCYFFDNIQHQDLSLQRILPLTYKLFVNNGIDSTVALNEEILRKTGITVSVFPSFIGDIVSNSGILISVLFTAAYALLALKTNNITTTKVLSYNVLFYYFAVGLIPVFGIFVYIYDSFSKTFALLFLLLFTCLNRQKKRF